MYAVGPPAVKHASLSSIVPPLAGITPHGVPPPTVNASSSARVPLNTSRSSCELVTPFTTPVSECCQNSHCVHGSGMSGHDAVVYCAIHSGEGVMSAPPVSVGHEYRPAY